MVFFNKDSYENMMMLQGFLKVTSTANGKQHPLSVQSKTISGFWPIKSWTFLARSALLSLSPTCSA